MDGGWSQWKSVGPCKLNGKQQRTRTCTNPTPLNGGKGCPGSNDDEIACTGTKAKFLNNISLHCFSISVDGGWSQWKSVGSCDTNGRQKRTRTCTDPTPLNGGKQCSGSDNDEIACPGTKVNFPNNISLHCFPISVDGGWTQWKSVGSCNTNGRQKRTRTCTNPTPLNGGAKCPGSDNDEVACPGTKADFCLSI